MWNTDMNHKSAKYHENLDKILLFEYEAIWEYIKKHSKIDIDTCICL